MNWNCSLFRFYSYRGWCPILSACLSPFHSSPLSYTTDREISFSNLHKTNNPTSFNRLFLCFCPSLLLPPLPLLLLFLLLLLGGMVNSFLKIFLSLLSWIFALVFLCHPLAVYFPFPLISNPHISPTTEIMFSLNLYLYFWTPWPVTNDVTFHLAIWNVKSEEVRLHSPTLLQIINNNFMSFKPRDLVKRGAACMIWKLPIFSAGHHISSSLRPFTNFFNLSC